MQSDTSNIAEFLPELQNILNGKNILVTGGTGSFGKKFTNTILRLFSPQRLIILSRDELKQFEMRQKFDTKSIRYFIGDVRDRDRLMRAFKGVDIVIHAAALKQVPAAEYNPFEAIKTNVLGAANVIDAAIDSGVNKVVALSTDKAANPINLYGATKLCSDKLFIAANNYSGMDGTRFSVVRYGNVIGSRGSVIPFFMKMRDTGTLPITDPRMTRFCITLEQGVELVLKTLVWMQGGEIFVPKIPSMNILDIAKAVSPECATTITGIRPGEKLHEVMVPEDDARNTLEFSDHYAILPVTQEWTESDVYSNRQGGKSCPDGFSYSSDANTQWLSVQELRTMLDNGLLEHE